MNPIPHSRVPSRGCSPIELLSGIAIIGILIPVVGKVRASGRASTSTAKLRQIGMAAALSTEDNRSVNVPLGKVANSSTEIWMQLLMPSSKPGPPDSNTFTDGIRSTVYRDPAIEGPINKDFSRRLPAVESDLELLDEQTVNADKLALGRHRNAVRVAYFDGQVEAMGDLAAIHRRVTTPGDS